jgi:thiol-disulfide isomerase/thioredoxin
MSATRITADLPIEGHLPSLAGATGWLNSRPLAASDLRDHVVLVDFWTYTCINWLRTLGYIRAWSEKYEDQGLIVIGVHTPEFPFEADVDNVRWAARDMRVEYPIALDSDYAVWTAFDNRYWPAVYIADAQGRIRRHQFGEGGYAECETVIKHLLRDTGRSGIDDDLVSVADEGIEAQADWASLGTPETYLGYERGERSTSSDEPLRLNEWALSGDWTVERRASVLNEAGGQLAFRFHARDLHLVLAPPAPGASVRFRVLIDGQPPGDAHGIDVDDQGNGTVVEPRLYQLIRQPARIGERTFEITFLDRGARAYVFTFG